ncbi:lipopolysaccharide biosynthesis protein [Exiguobacterium acetylicum]|uniref:lipopolysaccharide biosynthesis protein n=1 Tax=Exiguobacterium acetylicum TaxID=41170 RepID=UPI001EE1ADFA|nr:lipopolysaccharide biosynthesis protein [Exiguobacterium acetylicum]UKS55699.1 lipopolysaccharide biosynthesis protein [Exiguobacterium acetylicum]
MGKDSLSLRNKTYKGFFWIGLSTFSSTLMKLITIAVLSRFLTPKEFGIVAATQIIISFAEIFSTAGVGPAIIQKKEVSNKDISTGNLINVIFGGILFLILFMLSSQISGFVNIENPIYLKILSIIFLINSISIVSESLVQKEMDFRYIANVNIISLTIYSIASIVLALLDFGVWSIIYAQLLQSTIRSISFLLKKPTLKKIDISLESAKNLSYFGLGFTLSRIFNNIANQADNFVVSKYLGTSALGYYSRSYQLLMLPTNILGTIMDKVTFPLMSKLQTDNKKLGYIYTNFMLIYGVISLPIMLISIICSKELIHLFLGERWDNVVLPFQILMGGLFFRVGYKISDTAVRALGAVYKRLWVQVVYAIAVFTGALIGSQWGIVGVAISTTIAITLNYILMIILIWKIIKFDYIYLFKNLFLLLSGLLLLLGTLMPILNKFINFEIYNDFFNNLVEMFLKLTIILFFVILMYFTYYKLNQKNEFVQFILNQSKIKRKKKKVV